MDCREFKRSYSDVYFGSRTFTMARIDFRIYFHLSQWTRYVFVFTFLRPVYIERLELKEMDGMMITSRVVDSIATPIFWTAPTPANQTPGSVV
jgi:hypothetical protein